MQWACTLTLGYDKLIRESARRCFTRPHPTKWGSANKTFWFLSYISALLFRFKYGSLLSQAVINIVSLAKGLGPNNVQLHFVLHQQLGEKLQTNLSSVCLVKFACNNPNVCPISLFHHNFFRLRALSPVTPQHLPRPSPILFPFLELPFSILLVRPHKYCCLSIHSIDLCAPFVPLYSPGCIHFGFISVFR